jgi:hypothetical protein
MPVTAMTTTDIIQVPAQFKTAKTFLRLLRWIFALKGGK